MKHEELNSILIYALNERGFLFKSKHSRRLLDLHFYYDNNVSEVKIKRGKPTLYIKLYMWSSNKEDFISYKFWASIDGTSFTSKYSPDVKYQYISKVLARIYNDYGILELINHELELPS